MNSSQTLAAVDVGYPPDGGAIAALVLTDDPDFGSITEEHVVRVPVVQPYRPGAFYERELPALQAVLAVSGPVDLLIIDGYVDLDPAGRPGLGSHAHEALGLPIIGVAKSAFRSATHAIPVMSRSSRRSSLWSRIGAGKDSRPDVNPADRTKVAIAGGGQRCGRTRSCTRSS